MPSLKPSTPRVILTFVSLTHPLSRKPIAISGAMYNMIANAVITGGIFNNSIHSASHSLSPLNHLLEAVSHSAFHNSGERYDPPRCHPNTRVAVVNRLEHWRLRKGEDASRSILWLSGAAGAGKSAVMQSWAESCYERGFLLASFFFGRSDPTRSHAKSLVATIVYQIYVSIPPAEQTKILDAIAKDPLIFTRSIITQFTILIVNPLQTLFGRGYFDQVNAPRLIIIDGLDECLDRDIQVNILETVKTVIDELNAPFLFLIASRPERDINAFFNSRQVDPILARLVLDDRYLPDIDIDNFLRSKFEECRMSHPFRHLIPRNWPSESAIAKLIHKSSGQFIYASTVAKYVKSSRRNPAHSLEVVLDLRPASGLLPFAELDALYAYIFSGVGDIEPVLQLLSFMLAFSGRSCTTSCVENLFGLQPGSLAVHLCDMGSLLSVDMTRIVIMHASLSDFLRDRSRSGIYHVQTQKRIEFNLIKCYEFLGNVDRNPDRQTIHWALIYLTYSMSNDLILTPTLSKSLSLFSMSDFLCQLLHVANDESWISLIEHFLSAYLAVFADFLRRVDSPPDHYFTHRFLNEMDDIWQREVLDANLLHDGGTFRLALSTMSQGTACLLGWPIQSLSFLKNTDKLYFPFPRHRLPKLFFHSFRTLYKSPAYNSLAAYLCNPTQQIAQLEQDLFCAASQYCLKQLCIHNRATSAPPVVTRRLRRRRIHLPWKWRRRIVREHVGGPKETPWMWLQSEPAVGIFKYYLYPRRRDIVSGTYLGKMLKRPVDPFRCIRQRMERYHLWLRYVPLLLRRAGFSDDLMAICAHKRLSGMSQEFPAASRKARRAMWDYVEG